MASCLLLQLEEERSGAKTLIQDVKPDIQVLLQVNIQMKLTRVCHEQRTGKYLMSLWEMSKTRGVNARGVKLWRASPPQPPPASPFSPPLWSHHNNTSGEAVLLSLGPGRWQWGDREEQIKFRQKCFSPEISYTKSGRGPLIFCPQRTKTRTFKTSI